MQCKCLKELGQRVPGPRKLLGTSPFPELIDNEKTLSWLGACTSHGSWTAVPSTAITVCAVTATERVTVITRSTKSSTSSAGSTSSTSSINSNSTTTTTTSTRAPSQPSAIRIKLFSTDESVRLFAVAMLMLPPCYIVIAVLGALVLLHLLFELHYFTRSLLTVVVGLFCKKNRHILDTLSVRVYTHFRSDVPLGRHRNPVLVQPVVDLDWSGEEGKGTPLKLLHANKVEN
ncbi:hypothetical protein FOCC_FOCC005878 [Frankliniella occidentalis]|nr:hypothetical protein FOCC_FOCC005878 [Frankliniella occidentalis]